MSGKVPSFITGANAKIQLNVANSDGTSTPKTLAYASDLSYVVDTITIPVESFGRYEAASNEPISYTVSGSFNVIRYTSVADGSAPEISSNKNNAAGYIGVGEHLSPAHMLTSRTFDVSVYQRTGTATSKQFLRIKDCRISGRRASLNKRGVLVDMYSFVGILMQDADADTADMVANSGNTDLK